MEDIRTALKKLRSLGNERNRAGMARFGIETKDAYGISIPVLRKLAKDIGTNHALALELWKSEIHEARLLACLIDDPEKVTQGQMEHWAKGFNSWDVCDQCCGNLFDKTKYSRKKAIEWSSRKEEFVKRAGFVLMAALSVHDKNASDSEFVEFLSLIKKESRDDRNFVKKAVNWALRQIGKRNRFLNKKAVETAKKIAFMGTQSAKWIASDALRELTNKKVQKRLK
jgi:3-methyladenine DNA glycosylase AlkD